MKKVIFALAFAAIALCACSKDDKGGDNPSGTVAVKGVTLNQTEYSGGAGTQFTLKATIVPAKATNKKVAWSTDNATVATVKNGLVFLNAEGTATITVTTADGGFTADCVVTVNDIKVTSISITPKEFTGAVSSTFRIVPSFEPENASNQGVIWSSDNTEIASVDEEGNVTLNGEGSCIITATSKSNPEAKATCAVTSENLVSIIREWPGKEILNFTSTHPAFSKDGKTAYILSDNCTLVSIDVQKGTCNWSYRPAGIDAGASGKFSPVVVNPVSGDIYFSNRDDKTFAVHSDGTPAWATPVSCGALGTGIGVSTDGSVVFIAGQPSSRKFIAVNASTGTEIASRITNGGEFDKAEYDTVTGGDGTGFVYAGFAQMIVLNDTDVILWGAEHFGEYRLDKAAGKLKRIQYYRTELATPDSPKTCACVDCGRVSDRSSAFVSPDAKTAYFPLQNGKIAIINISTDPVTYVGTVTIDSNNTVAIYSGVIDGNGNVYLETSVDADKTLVGTVRKYALSDLVSGGTPAPKYKATVQGSSNNNFVWQCPAITADGTLYHSTSNGGCSSLFSIAPDATGELYSEILFKSPFSPTAYEGVIASTDNYVVVATKKNSDGQSGGVYIYKTRKNIPAGVWASCGGDLCGSKNVQVVYGK